MDWTWNNWVLVFIPVAWFVQNCIHEFSHLLVSRISEGREMLGFWPYPHYYEGRFYFARCNSGEPICRDFYGSRYIAPFYFGLLWATIGIITMTFIAEDLKIFCLPFILAGLIDALFFWYTYFFGSGISDGKLYRLANRIRKGKKGNVN